MKADKIATYIANKLSGTVVDSQPTGQHCSTIYYYNVFGAPTAFEDEFVAGALANGAKACRVWPCGNDLVVCWD